MLEHVKDFVLNFALEHDIYWFFWRETKARYFQVTGKKLNYKNVTDLNEKLIWLTRYWRHPLKTQCADKYLVRKYVESKGLKDILIPLLGVYNSSDEIDFNALPNKFVLKCNHGSGYNIICSNKNNLDYKKTQNQLDSWIKEDFYKRFQEIHYKKIKRKIICEKLVNDSAPIEYQFWCVNGFPDSILICRKDFNGTYEAWSYSIDGKHLCERIGESAESTISFSKVVPQMVEYSKKLSEPFPFVRVDFYEVNGQIFFAELTFTPNANILVSYNNSFLNRLGKKLILPPPV